MSDYIPNVEMFIQYQDAPNFKTLLQSLSAYLTIPIDDFFYHYFNLDTADTQGLDNWGIILNQGRTIQSPDYTSVFGFDTGIPPSPLATGYPQNYNNGTFYGGQTIPVTLTDDQYRVLLQFRYSGYVTNNSVASCMTIINNYIKKQYPLNPTYRCDIVESVMHFRYVFNFTLQPFEIALFRDNKVLPTAAGIGYGVDWV
jgi:hypothetical protein